MLSEKNEKFTFPIGLTYKHFCKIKTLLFGKYLAETKFSKHISNR